MAAPLGVEFAEPTLGSIRSPMSFWGSRRYRHLAPTEPKKSDLAVERDPIQPDPLPDSRCDLDRAFGGWGDGLIVVGGLGDPGAQGEADHLRFPLLADDRFCVISFPWHVPALLILWLFTTLYPDQKTRVRSDV
jgi:hypothetical protein